MKPFLLALMVCFPCNALAAEPAIYFQLDKAKSSIGFTATQNNSPVTATFSKYDAKIQFSPQNLADSSATVTIDTGSIQASYADMATLKGDDWFATGTFPKAVFTTRKIVHLQGNHYRADAQLRLRDKTLPVTLDFTLTESTPAHTVVDGTAVLKRNDFGVGQGEWKSTGTVKDEVTVTIHLDAKQENK